MRCAALILAAGESARLGRPKQLLVLEGVSLVRRAVRSARDAGFEPVFAVTGAFAAEVEAELAGTGSIAIRHEGWPQGFGSSIRAGVSALTTSANGQLEPDGVLLLPCDLPHVSAAHLLELRGLLTSRTGIVAAEFGNHLGPPVLFGRAYFDELRQLPSGSGARPVLERHVSAIIRFPLPEAAFDIDTTADWETHCR